ncbi:hypothetical protein T492DRAFT_922990 [Pavlovales sp. CCMP2436]|nr:hypothetical protein T492DRAFT_922990 [Pavlovales sp. CCMP2436]
MHRETNSKLAARESLYSSESLSAHCGFFPSQSLYSESLLACYGSFSSRPLQAASASRCASLLHQFAG